jgi:hypothetical protein
MPGPCTRQEERFVLYDLIMLGIVAACLVAIHLTFDALQRRSVKR